MQVDYSKYMDKIRFWQKTIESVKDFTGTSPPSVFVGKAFYPKVFVGLLSPPQQLQDANILDSPESWYKQNVSIEQILNFRGQMIYSRFKVPTVRVETKLMDVVKEVAMSRKQVDIEVELKSKPEFKFTFNEYFAPVGNPAPLENVRLASNPSVEKKVDYIVSDTDLKTVQAVSELYKSIPISSIQKIFSVGLLGSKLERKLVPTRWSITGVDDILGKIMLANVRQYEPLEEVLLFRNEYIGNKFQILLVPGTYQFELIELYDLDKTKISVSKDYEPYWGRKTYASSTGGGFYASRLPVLEYLEKIKKSASIIIVREITPEYYAPVGVWKVREIVRGAFEKPAEKFETLEKAFSSITQKCLTKDKWKMESKLFRILKEQKTVKSFLRHGSVPQ
ncbi:MAG: hypothetical protein HY362_01680 [Candidatus Aenigmarchaeota archaeon]|nr:hypothetical protein [Candidatus Aenigmarchaeota archaeon]